MRAACSVLLIALLNACFFLSCAAPQFKKDITDYRDQIEHLQAKLGKDPQNFEILKELGAIHFEASQYRPARNYLQRAYDLKSDDGQMSFYLGMTQEFLDEKRKAFEIHSRFAEFPKLSKYRRWMRGRFHELNREFIAEEIRSLVEKEIELSSDRITEGTVAVFPFAYQGGDKKYKAFGRGFSEMISNDLGQVRALKLLERLHLQTLLDELQLAQTELISQEFAPRAGKILGAGRILSGSFNVNQGDVLSVDVLSWDLFTQASPQAVSKSDGLNNFYRLEKEIVFRIIDEMNIDLTPQERDKIQRIPTANLQAFLAYCRGLEQMDGGNPDLAFGFFQQAASLDANFSEAQSAAETAEGVTQAGGSTQEAIDLIAAGESSAGTEITTDDLLNERFQKLEQNVGSNFLPGQDNRKSAEEAENSGADLGELAAPPPPPGNNQGSI